MNKLLQAKQLLGVHNRGGFLGVRKNDSVAQGKNLSDATKDHQFFHVGVHGAILASSIHVAFLA